MPMRRPRTARMASSDSPSMRSPPSRISPPAMRPGGSTRPMIAAPVTDLPAPDSPTTPRTSPRPMSNDTPSIAVSTAAPEHELHAKVADREDGRLRPRRRSRSRGHAPRSSRNLSPTFLAGVSSPEISPAFCCGRGSARCDKAYSLKPFRRSEGYAFSSAQRSFGPCALSQRHLHALATKPGEISGLDAGEERSRPAFSPPRAGGCPRHEIRGRLR